MYAPPKHLQNNFVQRLGTTQREYKTTMAKAVVGLNHRVVVSHITFTTTHSPDFNVNRPDTSPDTYTPCPMCTTPRTLTREIIVNPIKRLFKRRSVATQAQMNSLYKPPKFDMESRYAFLLQACLFAFGVK